MTPVGAGVPDPEAVGVGRVAVDDLDRGPRPLPPPDARGLGEPDRPAGAVDREAGPGRDDLLGLRAVGAQHVGEDGDGVVALEGDEGRWLGQPLAQLRLDPRAEGDPGARAGSAGTGRSAPSAPSEEAHPLSSGCPAGAPIRTSPRRGSGADGLHDRHRRLRVADQEQQGRRAVVDEPVAGGRWGRGACVELGQGAAVRGECSAQDAGPGRPVGAGLGGHRDPAVARARRKSA